MVEQFDEYVRSRGADLIRFATAMTADRYLAEDIVQTVLERAIRNWTKVEPASIDPYFRRAVTNEYVSWLRKWARIRPSEAIPDLDTPDQTDRVVLRSELAEKIALLPRRQRAALVMRFYVDLSDQDIADAMGCSPVTVRGYISRALRRLQADDSLRTRR